MSKEIHLHLSTQPAARSHGREVAMRWCVVSILALVTGVMGCIDPQVATTCPEEPPFGGVRCSGNLVCNYGEQTCRGQTWPQNSCACDDTGVFGCTVYDICWGGLGGHGGEGGVGGIVGAGGGGAGGLVPRCIDWQEGEPLCLSGVIDPIEPCCEPPAPPSQPNACEGDESIESPSSCTAGGAAITYLVTQLEVVADCNVGYDLDACSGHSCVRGGAAPAPGVNGVDNGLAGFALILSGASGGNLGSVNQWLADAICGSTKAPGDRDCETEIPRFELTIAVSARPDENCANVIVSSGRAELGAVIMNLSDDGCISGTLPDITLDIEDTRVNLSNVTLRATVSESGLSDGLMGAAADSALDALVARLFGGGYDGFNQILDINLDSSGETVGCNALSGTYAIGGIAE